ncbi:MAG TPA: hypothetical protein VLT36_12750 [Candidatus Dormibacteraeota bacterium]|nr:hypothetical protein [Candidatus Dormibacteraeota bacterium]
MKIQILCLAATVALVSGCAEMRKNAGASAENDRSVLTGGPVTGTRIKDLPDAVRNTLQQRAPNAEVADIDKERENGQTFYKVSFAEPGKNPSLWIAEDGSVLPDRPSKVMKNSGEPK